MTDGQLSLLDSPRDPIPARSDDPATAKDAAKQPRLKEAKATVLRAAAWCRPTFTASEVHADLAAHGSRMESGSVRSRLSQLADTKRGPALVRRTTGVRQNAVTGCWEQCWEITAEGREWLRADG